MGVLTKSIQAKCPKRQPDVFLTIDLFRTSVQHYVRSVESATLYRKQTVQNKHHTTETGIKVITIV